MCLNVYTCRLGSLCLVQHKWILYLLNHIFFYRQIWNAKINAAYTPNGGNRWIYKENISSKPDFDSHIGRTPLRLDQFRNKSVVQQYEDAWKGLT